MKFKDLVNHRLIVKSKDIIGSSLTEAEVKEVSPSGEYVKLTITNSTGARYTQWCDGREYKIIEDLGTIMTKSCFPKFDSNALQTFWKTTEAYEPNYNKYTVKNDDNDGYMPLY